MAIAFDAVSNVTAGTGDLSWTHTPTGLPRGILVLITQNVGITDEVIGVTYGGVPMTEVPLSPLIHSTGAEDGVIYGYHLGINVPDGAQTVIVDVNATASTKRAVAISVTAAANTEVETTITLDSGAVANPSVVLATATALSTFVAGALHSGQDAIASIAPGAGFTDILEHTFGTQTTSFIRRTAIASGGNVTVDWTVASEEAGVLAVAINEVTAVSVLEPNSDRDGSWTKVGFATHWQTLEDGSDATYIQNIGTGSYVTVNMATTTLSSNQRVKRVQLARRHKYNGAGSVQGKIGVFGQLPTHTALSTTQTATSIIIQTSPWWNTDPSGNEWTQASLDNMVTRVAETNTASGNYRLYEMSVNVDIGTQPTIVSPTVTGTTTTSRPEISWVFTDLNGSAQKRREVKIYDSVEYSKPGFSPHISTRWAAFSGQQSTTSNTWTVTADLQNGRTYRAYIKASKDWPVETSSGAGVWWSDYNTSEFTITWTGPNSPTLDLMIDDPKARTLLEMQARINLLTENQSSLEDTTTTGWALVGNTTIANTSASSPPHGTRALELTKTVGTGTAAATTPTGLSGFVVEANEPYTVYAEFRSAATPRTARSRITWYDAAGASTGSDVTGNNVTTTTTTWQASTATGTAPAAAAFARVQVEVDAAVISEVHRVDKVGLWPGTGGTWGPGGQAQVETTFTMIQVQDVLGPNFFPANIADAGNSLGEGNTAGWFLRTGGDLLEPHMVDSYVGEWCMVWGPSAAGSILDVGIANTSGDVEEAPLVAPNKTMLVTAWVKAMDPGLQANLKFQARNHAGVVGSTVASGLVSVSDTTWTQVTTPLLTINSAGLFAQAFFEHSGGVGNHLHIGAMQLEVTSSTTPMAWHDGTGDRPHWAMHREAPDGLHHVGHASQEHFLWDYEVPRGAGIRIYQAYNQAIVNGEVIASPIAAFAVWQTPDGSWWLKDVLFPQYNLQSDATNLRVTDIPGESITEDATEFHPLGRSLPVVISDWMGGVDGSAEIFCTTALKAKLDRLLKQRHTLLLQSPLGTSRYIRVIRRDWSNEKIIGGVRFRVGIEYREVAAPGGGADVAHL